MVAHGCLPMVLGVTSGYPLFMVTNCNMVIGGYSCHMMVIR